MVAAPPAATVIARAVAGILVIAGIGSWMLADTPRAWLGVTVADAVTPLGPAARVPTILEDSPAAAAGCRPGDVVLYADLHPIRRARDLTGTVKRRRPGSPLWLSILRGAEHIGLGAILAARPDDLHRRLEVDRDAWQEPARVLDLLAVGPGQGVADLGAGGGYFTERLAERVGKEGRVLAIEIDADAIAELRKRFPRERFPQVVVQRDTAHDPGLEPRSVDVVLLVDTFHELDDPNLVLSAARRALRPGGRLAVIDRPATELTPGSHAVPESHVVSVAETAGFTLLARHDLPRQFLVLFE